MKTREIDCKFILKWIVLAHLDIYIYGFEDALFDKDVQEQ